MRKLAIQLTAYVLATSDDEQKCKPVLVVGRNDSGSISFMPIFTWSEDVKQRVLRYTKSQGIIDCNILPLEDVQTFCIVVRGMMVEYVALDPEPDELWPARLWKTNELLDSVMASMN